MDKKRYIGRASAKGTFSFDLRKYANMVHSIKLGRQTAANASQNARLGVTRILCSSCNMIGDIGISLINASQRVRFIWNESHYYAIAE